MRRFYFLFLASLLFGCIQEKYRLPYQDGGEIIGLAGPVKLQKDTTTLYLQDYFVDVSRIDSIDIQEAAQILVSGDHEVVKVIPDRDAPWMMNLQAWIKGVPYSIPLERSARQWIQFTFDPVDIKYQNVQLAGEINGWNPKATELQLEDGIWQTSLLLNPGSYQYQLVLDGEWMLDPYNPDSLDNNAGGYNSILQVGNEKENELPVLITLEFSANEIELETKHADKHFVYWQNISLPPELFELEGNELEIGIPEQAANYERSYIRVWAVNEAGISNDILIPLASGKLIRKAEQLNRFDHHAMILYNVFVDRFYNADTTNDRPLNIPEVKPQADYHGGDIKGVTQKIREGYFDELGVNTIWISPLVKNPEGPYGQWPDPPTKFSGYHGYWPISFTEIDDRFGTEEDLMEMVETAHRQGMNVLLDFVANHVHELHPVYQEHPEWATNLCLPDGRLNTQLWDEQRLTTWFDTFMPSLDLSNPEVVEMLTDSAVYWVKKYRLDGFRHDATKHVPLIFWRTLTRKLKDEVMIPENKFLYQIGETYGNPELIGSYVSPGKLDAQFDFNVYDDAIAVFAKDDQGFGRLNESIQESLHYYGDHNLMGYITGNQDRPRFISLAGRALSFEEDAKLAGWTREIEVGDPSGYDKLSALTAFMMSIPGIPVIYFGDEIGDPGGNDPDNRRMLRFENLKTEEQKVKRIVQKLTKLRSESLEMIYGDFEPLLVNQDEYVFMRSYFKNVSVIVFNNSAEERTIEVKIPERFLESELMPNFTGSLQQQQNHLTLQLPAYSFEIINNAE